MVGTLETSEPRAQMESQGETRAALSPRVPTAHGQSAPILVCPADAPPFSGDIHWPHDRVRGGDDKASRTPSPAGEQHGRPRPSMAGKGADWELEDFTNDKRQLSCCERWLCARLPHVSSSHSGEACVAPFTRRLRLREVK